MSNSAIPYGKQHINQNDIDAVTEVLQSDFLTQGPKIKEFEESFAEYVGAKYAAAVSNGTTALHLAIITQKRGSGKVLTSPITFAASSNAVLYTGLEVEFVDIDALNYCLDPEKLREKLKNSPKGTYQGVIPVSFGGAPARLEEINDIAQEFGLWIVEDACHAPGAYLTNSSGELIKSGSCTYSNLACFSFHPVKHIAAGEGGMITTNDKDIYDQLIRLRTHGITKNPEIMKENHGGWYYEMVELGYNYRIADINAALAASQLKRAEKGVLRRNEIADMYALAFGALNLKFQKVNKGERNAHHLFVLEVDDRKGLYDFLRTKSVFAQIHYIPVHTLPYYQTLGFKKGDYPVSEAYYQKCISLPMYPSLTNEEVEFVIKLVEEFIQK